MKKISSQERSSLIRLGSSLPAGDENRKVILAGLVEASKYDDIRAAIAADSNIPGKHILDNAQVFGKAEGYDHGYVGDKSKVYGNAKARLTPTGPHRRVYVHPASDGPPVEKPVSLHNGTNQGQVP